MEILASMIRFDWTLPFTRSATALASVAVPSLAHIFPMPHRRIWVSLRHCVTASLRHHAAEFQHRRIAATVKRVPASPQCRNAALSVLFLLFAARVYAWEGFSSTGYSYGAAAYLDRPVHAHSAALGKAVTAWTGDLAGLQFNPAILDAAKGVHIVGSYEFLKDDRRFLGVETAFPIGGYVVVGASFRNFGVDGL